MLPPPVLFLFASLPALLAFNNNSLLWGTYKPHTLFSMTQKLPDAITVSLLYMNSRVCRNSAVACRQPNDLKEHLRYKFSNDIFADYLTHDGFDFIHEKIEDRKSRLNWEIKVLKTEYQSPERQKWEAQMSAEFDYSQELTDDEEMVIVIPIALLGKENDKRYTKVMHYEENELVILKVIDIEVNKTIGYLRVEAKEEKCLERQMAIFNVDNVGKDDWDVYDILSGHMVKHLRLFSNFREKLDVREIEIESPDDAPEEAGEGLQKPKEEPEPMAVQEDKDENYEKENVEARDDAIIFGKISFIQLVSTSACRIDVSFDSTEPPKPMSDDLFSSQARLKKTEFKKQILNKYASREDLIKMNEEELVSNYTFLACAVSNLIGGIAYYKGALETTNTLITPSLSKEVFSTTPSRKIFPRGFLWDEGFHEMLLCRWNVNLCIEVMRSWFSLVDVQGWVAREQVRGEEVKGSVPAEYQTQDGREANPPTLAIAVENIVRRLRKSLDSKLCASGEDSKACVDESEAFGKEDVEKINKFIKFAFHKMKLWFAWITHTQTFVLQEQGLHEEIPKTSFNYRWHCKGNCNQGYYLGSGLDDYPRTYKNALSMKHLDLHCWMMSFAKALDYVEGYVHDSVLLKPSARKVRPYFDVFQSLNKTLFSEFLDPSDNLFKDVLYERKGNNVNRVFSHSLGYINLFPLIIGVIPTSSAEFQAVLKLIADPYKLWSPYGVRSLSQSDHFYRRGDNYWTGPVWIPLNFLILRGLKLHYSSAPEARDLYAGLRENILNNVRKVWKETGYLWEVYNPESGVGERGFPFCGWTSLVAVISSDDYS